MKSMPWEQRIAGITICSCGLIGLYLYVKFTGELWGPFIVIDHVMMTLFYFFLYVVMPVLFLWFLYWSIQQIAEDKYLKKWRPEIKEGLEFLKSNIDSHRRTSNDNHKEIKAELEKLKRDFYAFKEQQEKMQIPVEEVQAEALQNFV